MKVSTAPDQELVVGELIGAGGHKLECREYLVIYIGSMSILGAVFVLTQVSIAHVVDYDDQKVCSFSTTSVSKSN